MRYLIVGLGNPGEEYAGTRHNVGFMVVKALARKHGLTFDGKEAKARIARGTVRGREVLLARPFTYMNLSGGAVGELVRRYDLPLERVLIVCDDLDLPLGTLRLRPGGGDGGHRGLRSIQEVLGTKAFPRLRVGIGRPPEGMEAADYVLSPFDEAERRLLEAEVLPRAVEAVELWLTEGIERAMNRVNRRRVEPAAEVSTGGSEASPPQTP